MAVRRIIFRLDFRPNFDIVDAPGTVMRLLDPDQDGFWDALHDAQAKRLIVADWISPDGTEFRKVSVEPVALTFSIERSTGFEMDRIEHDATFSKVLNRVQNIYEKFKLSKLQRAGIRFYYMPSAFAGAESLELFRKQISGDFTGGLEKQFGDVRDVGISYEGGHEDGVSYNFRAGPYFPRESKKYVEKIGEKLESETIASIFDIDLYETDFVMGVRILPWVKDQVARFRVGVKALEQLLIAKA